MSWTCARCATKHETDVERLACKRAERGITLFAIGILVAIVAVGLILKITWAAFIYGDWTCAFAECRKVIR